MRPISPNGAVLDARASLPLLIHGPEHAGASLFSVCVLASLVEAGERVVACTAYPEARAELLHQLGWEEGDARLVDITSPGDIARVGDASVAWVRSGDGALFEKAIRDLPDALSRVAFLKNSETMLTPELLELFRPLVRVIVAGDLSKTNEGHALRTLPWRTTVTFEDLPAYALSVPSALDRYRAWASGVWSGEVALA